MKTKPTGIVAELKRKHKRRLALAQRQLRREETKPRKTPVSYVEDLRLFWKWAWRVGKHWYGFNVGDIPPVWTDMLDDFLAWLETQCPDFEIHQIKSKLGSIRIYIDTKSDDEAVYVMVRSEIEKLRNLLRTPRYSRYLRTLRRAKPARKKVKQASSLSKKRASAATPIVECGDTSPLLNRDDTSSR